MVRSGKDLVSHTTPKCTRQSNVVYCLRRIGKYLPSDFSRSFLEWRETAAITRVFLRHLWHISDIDGQRTFIISTSHHQNANKWEEMKTGTVVQFAFVKMEVRNGRGFWSISVLNERRHLSRKAGLASVMFRLQLGRVGRATNARGAEERRKERESSELLPSSSSFQHSEEVISGSRRSLDNGMGVLTFS